MSDIEITMDTLDFNLRIYILLAFVMKDNQLDNVVKFTVGHSETEVSSVFKRLVKDEWPEHIMVSMMVEDITDKMKTLMREAGIWQP